MPDWDNTGSRQRDEDAAWRDLIARFGEPATADEPAPWPEREDMPPRPAPGPGVTASDGAAGNPGHERAGRADKIAGPHETEGVPGTPGDGDSAEADRTWRALEAEGLLGGAEPDVTQAARPLRRTPANPAPARGTPADDEEHFVPPAPPPLPSLDPLTKGAWTALFGGPGYLLIATTLRWSVPGYAAFCAVAAFVAGFAILVLRMHEPGPGGPDDGDDGAVV